MAATGPIDWASWWEGLQTAGVLARPASAPSVYRARALIEARFAERLDLQAIAEHVHFSPYHLQRLFKDVVGETPHEYLTRQRLDCARKLLETTDLSVTEICLRVGFSSLGSFSALFRRHCGHPPTRYRRRTFLIGFEPAAAQVPWCFYTRFRPVAA